MDPERTTICLRRKGRTTNVHELFTILRAAAGNEMNGDLCIAEINAKVENRRIVMRCLATALLFPTTGFEWEPGR